MCKHVTKSDRLLKKYAGDVFADTQLDEEFHSIVDRDVTAEERIAEQSVKWVDYVQTYSS